MNGLATLWRTVWPTACIRHLRCPFERSLPLGRGHKRGGRRHLSRMQSQTVGRSHRGWRNPIIRGWRPPETHPNCGGSTPVQLRFRLRRHETSACCASNLSHSAHISGGLLSAQTIPSPRRSRKVPRVSSPKERRNTSAAACKASRLGP